MQYELVKRIPTSQVIGVGSLNISKTGVAMFFDADGERDSTVLACMERVRIEWAAVNGIVISGFEEVHSKADQTSWQYQEWYLRYIRNIK